LNEGWVLVVCVNARVLLLSIDNEEFYELQRPIPLDDIVLLVTIVKEVCDFEHENHMLFFATFFRNFQPNFFYHSPMHHWIAAFTLQFSVSIPCVSWVARMCSSKHDGWDY
jgi:hypothetical protein